MSAKTTRIMKEARPLFWPWCAVILAGLLPLTNPPRAIEWISPIGFFFGIILLAAISFGGEFQHRTLSLLLSQPITRTEIWGEKLSVMAFAVVSAALVFYASLSPAPFRPDLQNLAFAGACIIAIMASGTFWTLFTKSTVGGVVLNIAAFLFMTILVGLIRETGHFSEGNRRSDLTGMFVFLCYAGVMLYLGLRSLAGFQVKGGMAGDDLLTADPDVMPGAITSWLRCRPTGADLNLIRKELRLLRPVWLLTILAALGWSCLTVFRLVHHQGSIKNFEFAAVSLALICTLLIAILAGSVSLGEERTSGTHTWQLTLPVSAFLQWRIKLGMALNVIPVLQSDMDNPRLWLRHARITVTPDKFHPSGFSCQQTQAGWTSCYYSAAIHLADGTELIQSYEPDGHRQLPFGRLTVRVRWAGAAVEESLWERENRPSWETTSYLY